MSSCAAAGAAGCWTSRNREVGGGRRGGKEKDTRAEAAVAAGGLRRPPTKSPNRIPFGFRASPRRVNNVFTRRFGSFAVGTPCPPPAPHPRPLFFSISLFLFLSVLIRPGAPFATSCPLRACTYPRERVRVCTCVCVPILFLFFSHRVRLPRCCAPHAVGVLHVPRMSPAPDYEY